MRKVLIANRGEIACRVLRSCRDLGLSTVAVYSEADANAQHVRLADEAYFIGPAPARESYLSIDRILSVAEISGADAVHPGYGFLSENPTFAESVAAAGLIWVGPSAETIAQMADKEHSRRFASAANVPVLPGSARFLDPTPEELMVAGAAVGYPLLVKASAGGGGIGIRRVDEAAQLPSAVRDTRILAQRAFGDPTVYLERLVPCARHIEVQVFGDGRGGAVHLFERECSLQRRFQEIVEESPAPGLDDATRRAMFNTAVALTRRQSYAGVGTVEFVLDAQTRSFYFLEMSTRIQVEHPVTEMRTGLDLVALQLQLAAGTLASLEQDRIVARGHSIECRLYAENPAKQFMPAPGRLDVFQFTPLPPGCRVDTGVRSGDHVSMHYDPLVAKLIAWGSDRDEAIARARGLLAGIAVSGTQTNLTFLRRLLEQPEYAQAELDTGFVIRHLDALLGS